MTFILADPLIKTLIDKGIISDKCTAFVIEARVGHVLRIVEDRMLDTLASQTLADLIQPTENLEQAKP